MTATTMTGLDRRASGGLFGTSLRFGVALAIAAGVTAGLFFLMQSLIWVEAPVQEPVRELPTVEIAFEVDELEIVGQEFPDDAEVVTPPPMRTRLDPDVSEQPTESAVSNVGTIQRVEPDPEFMRPAVMPPPPLTVRIAPTYPRRELARGQEGGCTIQYDILANGRTVNARGLECDSTGFERASLAAVDQWRHAVATGVPADTIVRTRVQTRLEFTLEG